MSNTPEHDGEISLDSVIDELLADAALASDAPAPMGSSDTTTRSPGSESSGHHETEAARTITGVDPALDAPGQARESDAISESLADSLDSLLKEAQELHATVSEVAPVREPEIPPAPGAGIELDAKVPPPPMAASPEADGEPESASDREPTGADDASSIQSLDAELAALTDDLLAGEIEAPIAAESAPVSQASTGETAGKSGDERAASSGGHRPGDTDIRADASSTKIAESNPATLEPSGPSIFVQAIALARRAAKSASEPARIALGLVSMPIVGKRSLQQSIGWLAAYTFFLASTLWIYLAAFHTPQGPVATGVPSGLHGGEHGAEIDSAHGDGHADPHATDPHGESHESGARAGNDAAHGSNPGASGGSHDAPKAAHEPPDMGGHGAKPDAKSAGAGHGASGGEATRVVNGYAISKHAPAKGGAAKGGAAKAGAKDAHGAKKPSGGH